MLTKKKLTSGAVLLGAVLLASCMKSPSSPGDATCTTEALGIMVVDVTDSITGIPVQLGLSGKYESGGYVGDFYIVENRMFSKAYERPGTYTVSIYASNYQPWVKENVVVATEQGGCHIIPVALEAKLVK